MRNRRVSNWKEVIWEIKAQSLFDLRFMFPELAKTKKLGWRMSKMICPFHKEKKPSFVFFVDGLTWHCFGCGKTGTIIDYYMLIKNVTFYQTIIDLAKIFKIKLKWENIK